MKVKGREKQGLLSLLFAPTSRLFFTSDIPFLFCPRHPVYHPVYKEGRKISTAGNQRFWCPGCIIVKGVSYGSFRRKLLVRQYIAAIQATYCRPSGIVFIQDILQGIHGSLLAHTDDFRHIPEKVI